MPRIKLLKQDHYDFEYSTELKVRDINYGGHLGNDAVVSLTHEARIDFLSKMGFSELDIGGGTGIIMADLAVNYLAEGFLRDRIVVRSRVGEVSGSGFRVFYRLSRAGEGADARDIALAETGLAAFDYKTGKVARLPEVFTGALPKR